MKTVNNIIHSILLFLFILLTFAIQGCSVNPVASDMVGEIAIVKNHPYTVSLELQGDEGDGFLETTFIRTLDLRAAIETSIIQSKLFTKIVQTNADYCLKIDADVQAPEGGYVYTAAVGGVWLLSNCTTNNVVMDEFIRTSDTKTFGDAFNGNTRMRLALGEASKKFIEEGLNKITKLDL